MPDPHSSFEDRAPSLCTCICVCTVEMFSTRMLRLLVQYIIYEVCWVIKNSNLGVR